ncbi:MAG: XdhC family protein [Woeseiaceae bacterium]
MFVDNIIPACHGMLEQGHRVALVTLLHIDGSSPRPQGSQLGVADSGQSVGMITGGCAEKAVIAEALRCLENDENKIVRYGVGSPYLDVVLPCGSGIDLFIETRNSAPLIKAAHDRQQRRKPVWMAVDRAALASRLLDTPESALETDIVNRYEPDYRLMVFGEGANLVSFCELAKAGGFTISAYSPDQESIDILLQKEIDGHRIHRQSGIASLAIDEYTAIVTLFHEHEWERDILHAALNSEADYIGALGSQATHSNRLQTLAALGATRRSPDCIHGPIGLDIGATNPNEIAVSVLAEITAHRRGKIR